MYSKIKKIMTTATMILAIIAFTLPLTTVNAAGNATIKGKIKIFNDADAIKNSMGKGTIPGATQMAELFGVTVKLLNADENELQTQVSDTHGDFSFANLEDGEYYVEINKEAQGNPPIPLEIIPGIVNDVFAFSQQSEEKSKKIVIQGGKVQIETNDVATGEPVLTDLSLLLYPVIKRPYAIALRVEGDENTAIAQYSYLADEQEYHSLFLPLLPGATYPYMAHMPNFKFANGLFPFAPDQNQPDRVFTSVMGAIFGSQVKDYRADLPTPELTEQAVADGYKFIGYKLDPESASSYKELVGLVLDLPQVLDIVIKGDLILNPYYEIPVDHIIFKTNAEKGSLDNIVFQKADKEQNKRYDIKDSAFPNQITVYCLDPIRK